MIVVDDSDNDGVIVIDDSDDDGIGAAAAAAAAALPVVPARVPARDGAYGSRNFTEHHRSPDDIDADFKTLIHNSPLMSLRDYAVNTLHTSKDRVERNYVRLVNFLWHQFHQEAQLPAFDDESILINPRNDQLTVKEQWMDCYYRQTEFDDGRRHQDIQAEGNWYCQRLAKWLSQIFRLKNIRDKILYIRFIGEPSITGNSQEQTDHAFYDGIFSVYRFLFEDAVVTGRHILLFSVDNSIQVHRKSSTNEEALLKYRLGGEREAIFDEKTTVSILWNVAGHTTDRHVASAIQFLKDRGRDRVAIRSIWLTNCNYFAHMTKLDGRQVLERERDKEAGIKEKIRITARMYVDCRCLELLQVFTGSLFEHLQNDTGIKNILKLTGTAWAGLQDRLDRTALALVDYEWVSRKTEISMAIETYIDEVYEQNR